MLALVSTRYDVPTEILHDPGMLATMAADLDAMGTIGEIRNKQVLFLAMVSRLLPRPVNVVVKGSSSVGKSRLVEGVAGLFGPEVVLQLSSMSPRALYYMGSAKLAHKVLYIDEYMPHAARDHALRLMQSAGHLTTAVAARDEAGFFTDTHTVKGPIAFITTTTRGSIFDENETRAFAIHVDDSDEQTMRIQEALLRSRTRRGPRPTYERAAWQTALSRLQSYDVIIPYAEHLHLAPRGLARDRRDMVRVLSLIDASALAHQMQRRHVEVDGQRYLEASLNDYRIAYELAGAFLEAPTGGEEDEPVSALVAACRTPDGVGVSYYDLMERLGWSRPTVIKYCQQAMDAGRLEQVEDGPGGRKRYRVTGQLAGTLRSPEEVAARWRAADAEGWHGSSESDDGPQSPSLTADLRS